MADPKPISPQELFNGIAVDPILGQIATDSVTNLSVTKAGDLLFARMTEIADGAFGTNHADGQHASEPYRAAFAWAVASYLNENKIPMTPRVVNSLDLRPFLDRALALPEGRTIAWENMDVGVPLPKRYMTPIRDGEQKLYASAMQGASVAYDANTATLSPLARDQVQITNPAGTAAAGPVATPTGDTTTAPAGSTPATIAQPAGSDIMDPFATPGSATQAAFGEEAFPGAPGTTPLEPAFDVEDLRNLVRIGMMDIADLVQQERASYGTPGVAPQNFPIQFDQRPVRDTTTTAWTTGGTTMSAAQALDYIHTLSEDDVTAMQKALGQAGFFDELGKAPILGDAWDPVTREAWIAALSQSVAQNVPTTELLKQRAVTYRERKMASQPKLDTDLAQANMNAVAQKYMGRELAPEEMVQFRIWLHERQRETSQQIVGVDGVTEPPQFDINDESWKYAEETFRDEARSVDNNGRWYNLYKRIGYRLEYPEEA